MNAIQQLLTDHLGIWTDADTEKKTGRGRSSGNVASVYGIRKLRELILELAVRGKLVPQDNDWKPTSLGDLGSWAVGSGFPTKEQGLLGLEILFAKVSDMNLPENSKFIATTNHTISRETANRLRVNIHPAGTVVFPKIGGAIATNKRRILLRPTAIDNNCLGLTPKDGVSTEWLFLFLTSIDFTRYQAGTSVPALAQGVLEEIPALLPPLAEQHRIVAKVDELMALCDQLETRHNNAAAAHEKLVSHLLATLTQSPVRPELVEGRGSTGSPRTEFEDNWQRIAAHFDTLFTTEASIDALKQTLLQLAVMGKLVPQDPNDEPASALLKRIQAEKARLIAEGKIKKDKLLPPIADDEKPFELPQGWEWIGLSDLMPEFQNGVSSRGDKGGKPTIVLRLADIKNRCISLDDTRTIPINSRDIEKYQLSAGDILITRVNGSADIVGSFILNDSEVEAIYCDHFIRMRIAAQWINANYLCLLGESSLVRNKIQSLFITTAGQKTVNQGHIGSLLIALPPIGEQRRIVAKVDELMALCDQLNSRLTLASQVQQKLADVVVEQAIA